MKPTARTRTAAAARKSTALITLALVPLNLMGLGFAGCDSRDDSAGGSGGEYATVDVESPADGAQFTADFADANDPFTLDPQPLPANGPTTRPTSATQPARTEMGRTAFAHQPSFGSTRTSTHHHGVLFLPMPYSPSYTPPYRPPSSGFVGGGIGGGYSSRSSRGFTPTPRYSGSSGGVSRSTGSSSGVSHSSGTSRGGFGSSGMSHSSSSGS